MDDGGIHHRPLPQHQVLLSQVLLHCLENLLGQLMLFHTMGERQDGGGIRDVILGKINAGKAVNGAAINQGIFHGFVPQGPPVLHQVNPHHGPPIIGRGLPP